MNKVIYLLLVFFCFSCSPAKQEKASNPLYYDLNDYFTNEISRLKQQRPQVLKTVNVKGKSEQKQLQISNWETELASFKDADINKASWRGEFKETTKNNSVTYTTTNPNIPIKKIEIIKRENLGIVSIKIYKLRDNALYQFTDTLTYIPDSSYSINNKQKIRLLAEKQYVVHGKFLSK